MLTATLKELEKAGLIKRDVYPEVPLRVEYDLTKEGIELRQAIIPLLRWVASKSETESNSCPILNPKSNSHIISKDYGK